MMSLASGKLELLICLHFPMAAARIKQGGHDVASGSFKWPGGALMWPHGTLKNPFRKKQKQNKRKKTKRFDKAY